MRVQLLLFNSSRLVQYSLQITIRSKKQRRCQPSLLQLPQPNINLQFHYIQHFLKDILYAKSKPSTIRNYIRIGLSILQ